MLNLRLTVYHSKVHTTHQMSYWCLNMWDVLVKLVFSVCVCDHSLVLVLAYIIHTVEGISCNKDSYFAIHHFHIIIYMNMNWLLCHHSNVHNNHSKTQPKTTYNGEEREKEIWNAKIKWRQGIVCTSNVPKEKTSPIHSWNFISTSIIKTKNSVFSTFHLSSEWLNLQISMVRIFWTSKIFHRFATFCCTLDCFSNVISWLCV